ncbi:MAG: flagellar hook-associated protein FlgL, partial [Gammaproteobacteria bacterium]
MRVSSQTLSQSWLAATRRSQADLLRTQLQVATGKKILSPADDPEGAMRILGLNQAMDRVAVHQDHAEAARRRLSLEEQALAQVSGVLDRMRELSIRASSPALDDAGRAGLATEVRALQDKMLQLANSQDGRGEYLFAGTRVTTEPFAVAAGQVGYQGDQGTRRLEIGDGRYLEDGEPGDRVFMAVPGGNGRFAVDAAPANTGTGVIASSSLVDPATWSGQSFTVRFTGPGVWEASDGGGNVVASGTHTPGDTLA